MTAIWQSPISLLHIAAALLALGIGTGVLIAPKGTNRHRLFGYTYVGLMLIVLTTAFNIYHLFGRFGVVHGGAVVACLALLIGVGAPVLKWPVQSWPRWHYVGMGCSVAGLYATFLVEATYRLFPPRYFWWSTVGTSLVVFLISAGLLWRGYKRNGLATHHQPVLIDQLDD